MTIATTNPTTGIVEKTFEPHTAAEIERRISLADSATRSLRTTTFAERSRWMRAAADLLEADGDAVARILTLEMGKPFTQAQAEVLKSSKGLRFYAEHTEEFLAPERVEDPSSVNASYAGTRYEPLGVVLAVMPWNYPMWQVLRFAAPALMAGNAGLLKHASNVPQSALYLDTLFLRAGFPPGSFASLLIGSREVADVIRDHRVKAVTLTGSEQAGREVAATAGREIKKTVLELGGSDAFVVMPSADLDEAVDVAVLTRTQNNGQSCIAGKRFIVHADVYERFAAMFAERLAALTVGDPMDPATQIGPLATESGRDELSELVEDAKAKGAAVLAGGVVPNRSGWFYPPTLLADLNDDMRIVMEEAFGPVASLYRADDRQQAVDIANQTTFGLGSSVWSTDPDDHEFFTSVLDAGAVFINGMTASFPELPFGGIKSSGYGRELAAVGVREFCNLKTVWKK